MPLALIVALMGLPPGDATASGFVELLRDAPEASLPARVDEAGGPKLTAAAEQLDPASPAYGWVALRLGRLAAHRRDLRGAETWLARARAVPATRAEATRTLELLAGRRRVRPGRLGILLPLSGPYADIGKVALAAIKMALADHPELTFAVRDTAGDAARAPGALEELVRDGVGAIVGPVGTLEGRAAALEAERLEVPLMTLSAAEDITRLGTFVFRHRLTRGAQGGAVARYACQVMGMRTFAILYPESEYGRDMRKAFWDAIDACGGEVVGVESYPVHATEFNDAIKRLVGRHHLDAREPDERWEQLNRKAKDPALHVPPVVEFDALFVPDGGKRARLLLPFLSYWDIELRTTPDLDPKLYAHKYGGFTPKLVQVLGGSGFNDPRFAQRVGKAGHNAVFVDGFLPDSAESGSFTADWQAKHGRTPPALAAHAYDATQLLAAALKGRADRAEIRRALLQTTGHEGLFGPTRVSGDGEVEFDLHVLTIDPIDGIVLRTAEGTPDDYYEPTEDEDRPR